MNRNRQQLSSVFTFCLLVFLACCGMFASNASAQKYVFGRADFQTGIGPLSAIVADFNGDGKPDVAVVNSGDNTVSILLGTGDGTFAPKKDFTTGKVPVSVVAGDFNHDGKLDLAIANNYDLTVSILLGNGDGTFESGAVLATQNPPQRLVTGDFNGDGKLDLATVNSTAVTGTSNNTVSILLGHGDGTFASAIEYPMDGATFSIVTGDFNGDGKLDLAVGNRDLGVISVLLGNGDGTFRSPLNNPTGTGAYVSSFLIARDFNGDGILDLADCGGSTVSILLGKGNGTFQSPIDYAVGGTDAGWLTANDFNGDGKLDLAVSSGYAGGPPVPTVSVLLGKGDGTFQPHVDYNTGGQPYSVISAEVNGDGKEDLVMATAANSVAVLLGNGDGTFSASADYVAGSVPMSVTAGDFDGDGKLDLAVANRADNTVSVLLANGVGTFQPPVSYAGGPSPRAIIAADLNGDKRDDLIVADESCLLIVPPCPTSGGSVSILISKVDGSFQAAVPYAVNGYPVSVAVGDFNRDEKTDVVVANGNSPGTVAVFRGNGDGTLQSAVYYATAPNPLAVAVGDFNDDGMLDLAVAAAGSGSVSILLGKGDGTFQPHVEYSAGQGPIAIVAADLNHDGKLDLAVSNNSDNTVSVLLGNGDGTFQTQKIHYPGHLGTTALAVGDFNADGYADLAVANDFDNTITFLLGQGDGTFPTLLDYEYSTFGASFGFGAADLGGDGALDLAVANFGGGAGDSISVLWNTPVIGLFPTSLSFGNHLLGTSIVKSIALRNPGSAPLQFTGVTVSGPQAGDFEPADTCPQKIPAASGCAVSITFSPKAPGTSSATVVISDSAAGGSQFIRATGAAYKGNPVISVTPSSNPVPYGSSETLTVKISGAGITATGTVTFFDGSGQLGPATLSGGVATYATSAFSVGTHSISASYSGDGNYNPGSSTPFNLTVQKGVPTITLSEVSTTLVNTQVLNVAVTVSGAIGNPAPQGSLMLTGGGYSSRATALSGGTANITVPAGALILGSDTLTVAYTPSASSGMLYTVASQTLTVTVLQVGTAASTVTLKISPASITDQQGVGVTVSVAGGTGQATPTGTVALASGTYNAAAVLANGAAMINILAATLPDGSDTITATYSGDGMYARATATGTVTVSTVLMTATAPSPVPAGSSTTATLTLTAGSYFGTMNLSCALSTSPTNAQTPPTCTLNPETAMIASGGSATTTATFKTTGSSSGIARPFGYDLWRLGEGGLALAGLLMFGARVRRCRLPSVVVALAIVFAVAMDGCGGHGSSTHTVPGTTAGNYVFTVTATDATNTKITTTSSITLTVQ